MALKIRTKQQKLRAMDISVPTCEPLANICFAWKLFGQNNYPPRIRIDGKNHYLLISHQGRRET